MYTKPSSVSTNLKGAKHRRWTVIYLLDKFHTEIHHQFMKTLNLFSPKHQQQCQYHKIHQSKLKYNNWTKKAIIRLSMIKIKILQQQSIPLLKILNIKKLPINLLEIFLIETPKLGILFQIISRHQTKCSLLQLQQSNNRIRKASMPQF